MWPRCFPHGQSRTRDFNRIDLVFLQRLFRLCRLGLPKTIFSCETIPLVALPVATLMSQLLVYQLGKLPSEFYPVLMSQDRYGFGKLLVLSVSLSVLEGFILALISLLGRTLAIYWRRNITSTVHRMYFSSSGAFHHMSHHVDNPDQRIAQDIANLCAVLFEIAPDVLAAPFIIIYYTIMTWWITGWIGPVVVYAYFIGGFLITRTMMGWVAEYVFEQERCEGNFRYQHTRVRGHTEAIAFYRSYGHELGTSQSLLTRALNNQRSLMLRQMCVDVMVHTHAYIGGYLSYVVIGIPIFMGVYDHMGSSGDDQEALASLISFSAFICLSLIGQFSHVMTLSNKTSLLAGYTGRVGELLEFIRACEGGGVHAPEYRDGTPRVGETLPSRGPQHWGSTSPLTSDVDGIALGDVDGIALGDVDGIALGEPVLSMRSVEWATPHGDVLGRNLSLKLSTRDNLLIKGPSGCGKTSLLRVLAGLWSPTQGTITFGTCARPTFFLPQTPYLPLGSLYTLVTYPCMGMYVGEGEEFTMRPSMCPSTTCLFGALAPRHGSHALERGLGLGPEDEGVVRGLLDTFALSHLERQYGLHGDAVPWDDILSAGEKQRVCVARMLYHKPKLVFMDEATCHMDQQMRHLVYQCCREYGMVCVTVGHDDASIMQYHNKILSRVEDEGEGERWRWELRDLDAHESATPGDC